jgi:hypothetical protein
LAAIYEKNNLDNINGSISNEADLLKIDVVSQLHILGMDAQNLKMVSQVRDTNVNFTIEATKSS